MSATASCEKSEVEEVAAEVEVEQPVMEEAPEAGEEVENEETVFKEEEKSKGTKGRKAAPKEKKAKASHPSHPPYFQMIKDAIMTLDEKSGSSAYAIAKHVEEKHKGVLPANFKKILWLQLKNCTAKGKLIKIKASFKLADQGKKSGAAKPPTRASSKNSGQKKNPSKPAKPAKKVPTAKRTKKSTPAAKPKQPKSIKSPAAKKTKKATA